MKKIIQLFMSVIFLFSTVTPSLARATVHGDLKTQTMTEQEMATMVGGDMVQISGTWFDTPGYGGFMGSRCNLESPNYDPDLCVVDLTKEGRIYVDITNFTDDDARVWMKRNYLDGSGWVDLPGFPVDVPRPATIEPVEVSSPPGYLWGGQGNTGVKELELQCGQNAIMIKAESTGPSPQYALPKTFRLTGVGGTNVSIDWIRLDLAGNVFCRANGGALTSCSREGSIEDSFFLGFGADNETCDPVIVDLFFSDSPDPEQPLNPVHLRKNDIEKTPFPLVLVPQSPTNKHLTSTETRIGDWGGKISSDNYLFATIETESGSAFGFVGLKFKLNP